MQIPAPLQWVEEVFEQGAGEEGRKLLETALEVQVSHFPSASSSEK